MRRKKKKSYLKSTDHRLDIGPAGRNLFISRDKQAQDRSARHIKMGMRVIIAAVIVILVVGIGMFVAFYLVPYFHAEFNIGGTESSETEESSLSSGEVVSVPMYDAMGLPIYRNDISLFVINENSPAKADSVPETVKVSDVLVDSRIADALRLMVSAAKGEGLALIFTEGYVSYEEQGKRFDAKVKELTGGENALTAVMARTEARTTVPMAGESDLQTGMCVTISGDAKTFSKSQTYSWLKANMGKYGFVFRYPENKEEYTGLAENSLVLRYVGSENAAAMQQRSMCLEEYLSYLGNQ